MPIKKSAVYSFVLAIGSVCLLFLTSYQGKQTKKCSNESGQIKCSRQCNTTTAPLQWNIVSGNILNLEG